MGVINHDVHGLFDGPGYVLSLPTHYGEIVKFDDVSCSLGMVKERGRGL